MLSLRILHRANIYFIWIIRKQFDFNITKPKTKQKYKSRHFLFLKNESSNYQSSSRWDCNPVGIHTPDVVLFVSGSAVSTVSAGTFQFIGMCAHAEWHPDVRVLLCVFPCVYALCRTEEGPETDTRAVVDFTLRRETGLSVLLFSCLYLSMTMSRMLSWHFMHTTKYLLFLPMWK